MKTSEEGSGKGKKQGIREAVRKTRNKGGENELFKIAKQRNRQSKDIQQVRVIKSKTGETLMEEKKVKQRWKDISTTYSTRETLEKEEK